MSADSYFSQANEQFVAEDYQAAGELYNQAIQANPNVANYYIARAANYIKLKKYKAAMTDAEAAIKLEPNNNLSHFRRATALFYLDNFEEAKSNFEKAAELGNKQSAMWIRKCDAELDRLKPKSNNNNTKATPAPAPTKPTATSVSAAVDQAIAKAAPPATATISNVKLAEKVKDSFFQVKSSVTITLFAKNLKEEDVKIDLNSSDNKTLSVQLRMPDSSVYSKTWKLFAPVKSEIKTEVTPYKVEITLEKQSPEDWIGLEEKEAEKLAGIVKRENVLEEGKKPAYPSSSKKKVEWNDLEKEVKKEIEEEKPEGKSIEY